MKQQGMDVNLLKKEMHIGKPYITKVELDILGLAVRFCSEIITVNDKKEKAMLF